MSIDMHILNGTVVTSLGVLVTDVAVNDGKIFDIGPSSIFPKAEIVIDAKNKLVIQWNIHRLSTF